MSASNRTIFRLPWVAIAVPVLLFFCITPLATAGGWWGAAFAVPVIAFLVVLLAGTTVDPVRFTTRWLTGRRSVSWAEVDGLEFHGSRWAVAVAHDGRRLRLPMVRPRDLPRLVAASGGQLRLDPGTVPWQQNGHDLENEEPALADGATAAGPTAEEVTAEATANEVRTGHASSM